MKAGLFVLENPALCVGFRKAYSYEEKENLRLLE